MSTLAFWMPGPWEMAVFTLVAFIIWLKMLIDCITRTPNEGNRKLIWTLVIIFTGIIGALVYSFVQRPKNPPKA